MQNLHRITGAVFVHEKLGLCKRCQHGSWPAGEGQFGRCAAMNKLICCPQRQVKLPRCRHFAERPEQD